MSGYREKGRSFSFWGRGPLGTLWAVVALASLVLLAPVFPLRSQAPDQTFYYGTTGKVPLTVSTTRIIVKFEPGFTKRAAEVLQRLAPLGKAQRLYQEIYAVTLREPARKAAMLEDLKKDPAVLSANPMYVTQDGQEMGVTDEICLEFNTKLTDDDQARLLAGYKARVVPRKEPWEKYFVMISVGKEQNALDVANRIMESGRVRFAHPDFVARTVLHAHIPNDAYFARQFFLSNTGQLTNDGHTGTPDADIDAPEAWDITRGSNAITIAVIDEGVELHNNDLPGGRLVVLNGSNFASGSANDPGPVGDGAHGTCCAGIVAAEQDNTEGVSGVAPLCRIMPVRIPFGSVPSSTYANAINFAWSNGADILSNSWGYSSTADIPVITAAISNAVTSGRGGIGSVVVWSAGNTADHAHGSAGYVSYPGCVSVANVITVGASDRNDHQANYSPTGAAVDVVAPSHRAYSCQIAGESFEVWSTDIVGSPGYNTAKQNDCGTMPTVGETLPSTGTNNLNFTGRMGGTSAACPEVAGVAGLILTLNPGFTPAQVYNAVINSADKVGGTTYTAGRCDEMGFGRVNAWGAIAPRTWMQDTPNDLGLEPNPTGDPMYVSDDVWVRKTPDGGLVHENAEYRAGGLPNAVYVRVRNAGNQPGGATLKVYWAKASSGLGWPAPWDGTVATPALMGGLIDAKTTGSVPAHGESLIEFDWRPPNPADYAMFGADQNHFCLLARLETSASAPYGMTIPETGNLGANVRNNSHIVWKNISVFDNVLGDAGVGGMLVANFTKLAERTRVVFAIPRAEEKTPLYRYGTLTVVLPDRFYKLWKEAGGKGSGFEVKGRELRITSGQAWIGDINLKPGEALGLEVRYKGTRKPETAALKDFAFHFDVQQMTLVRDKWVNKGAVRYAFYPLKRPVK
jgi:hypothetical protein